LPSKAPKVFVLADWLRARGYAESTIKHAIDDLLCLARKGLDLDDPRQVFEHINRDDVGAKRRGCLYNAYRYYTERYGISLEGFRPKATKEFKLPFIPSDEMVEKIVSRLHGQTALAVKIAKECGLRRGEALSLKLEDIDLRGVIRIRTLKKRGKQAIRMVKAPEWLLSQIKAKTSSPDGRIFNLHPKNLQNTLRRAVKKLAAEEGNLDYLKVHFHSFRHYFATKVYLATKDLVLVKELLGHERIEDTMIYVHIVRNLEGSKCRTEIVPINNPQRIAELIEKGWKPIVTTNQYIILAHYLY
jgi:integrase